MRFSTKTRYGIRAMIEIALADQSKGIFQKDIAQNQEISNKYLDQIILGLKVAGLINNVKGHKSGYALTRPAAEITMLDIHNAFEAGICVIECMSKNFKCDRHDSCLVKDFWFDLNEKIRDHFQGATLADIIAQKKKEVSNSL